MLKDKRARQYPSNQTPNSHLDALQQGIDSVQDYAIFLLDPQGHVMTWNKGAEKIKGYSADEIIGQSFMRFYTPEDVERHQPEQILRTALEQGHYEVEGWRVRKDGSTFWADVVITPFYDDEGKHAGFVKVTKDLTEKRLAEERIRILQQGIDSVQDYAIFLLDPQGRVMTWNKGAEKIKGYSADEIIGQSFMRFYLPDDIKEHQPERILYEALTQGRYDYEGWRVRKDGSTFWADVVITPLYDEKGKHIGFIKVTRDLTEKRLAEEHIRTLQQGIDSVQDYAIFLLDTKGRVNTWNKGAEQIQGYTEEEILGQPFTLFFQREDVRQHYPEKILQEAKEQGSYSSEGWCLRKDGASFWADFALTPLTDDEGNHLGFIQVTKDLSERKRAEASLKQSVRNYKTIAELSPVGIFHISRNLELIYANDRAYEIMGLSHDTAQHKGWLKAIHPEDQEHVIKTLSGTTSRNKIFRSEFRFLHPDLQELWVLCIVRPEIDKAGRTTTYIQAIVDINDRKMLEQKERERLAAVERAEYEQRQRAEEAEANKKRLTNYIDVITHGLRNPLMGIQGSNTFIQKDIKDIRLALEKVELNPSAKAEITRYLNDMDEQVESITACTQHSTVITNDVLDLSRLDAKSKKLVIQPFRVQDVIHTVEKMYHGKIKEKGLQFIVNMPQEELLVKGDKHTLELVLTNLITNAIKFTAAGHIALSLSVQEADTNDVVLQFKVEDTGIGMTEEEKHHIFNRFEQANKWVSHEYGGSGLGLYISKQLVQLMQGGFVVESEKGKGSSFIFTARCSQLTPEEKAQLTTALAEQEQETDTVPIETTTQRTILIAEDNPINQKILTKQLNRKGYLSEVANDGLEALEKWRTTYFDAIIMDIEMPKMNGLEVTHEIRRQEKTLDKPMTPIIGLSGNARYEQKQKALQAGMTDYLVKPYQPKALYQALESCFKKVALPRQRQARVPFLVEPAVQSTRMESPPSLTSCSSAFFGAKEKAQDEEAVARGEKTQPEQELDEAVSHLRDLVLDYQKLPQAKQDYVTIIQNDLQQLPNISFPLECVQQHCQALQEAIYAHHGNSEQQPIESRKTAKFR